jgi:hypothetical protein
MWSFHLNTVERHTPAYDVQVVVDAVEVHTAVHTASIESISMHPCVL